MPDIDVLDFPALKEAQGKLNLKNQQLHDVFTEAGPAMDMALVKSLDGDSASKVEAIRVMNEEIDSLGGDVEKLKGVALAAARAKQWAAARETGAESVRDDDRPGNVEVNRKSFGELFVASQAFKGSRSGGIGPAAMLDTDLKTTMATTAGWAPETTRTGRVVDFATRPVQVLDLFPKTTTRQAAVVYMEETTLTNAAAETAEAGTYAESALAYTQQSSPVRKIATFLPVTDEQLEDVDQVQGYVDNRLRFMLQQRLDSQSLVGNGTAPNLRGLNNIVGIQTQAKGSDPTPDAFYKAMVNIRITGRSNPDSIVVHPLDWMDVKLLRTADGIYIWGNPSEVTPDRLWGMTVAQSDAQTQNTGLVFDSSYTELSSRRGVEVQISNSHASFFITGLQAIRADVRVAFIVYRPVAVSTVTGI